MVRGNCRERRQYRDNFDCPAANEARPIMPTAAIPAEPGSPTTVAFLLVREFSMMSVVSAVEPLRAANRLGGKPSYAWRFYSADGAPIAASNGMIVNVSGGLTDLAGHPDQIDYLFVCAGTDPDPPDRARLHATLHKCARSKMILGSLSAGTFILARAGLLDGYRCTVHWEFQPAFEEEFPDLGSSPGLYVIDRDRWTGSGGIAGMDMMLHLIAQDHGLALSRAVANWFQIDRIRNAAIHQRPGQLDRLENLPSPLQKAIDMMMANIETPLGMEEIAALSGLRLRRMERMFKSKLDTSPAHFYRGLRLEKARELLLHTNMSTLDIGILTGFSSSSHFAMAYQRHYGMRPTDARRATKGPAPARNRKSLAENPAAKESNK
jgi:transcriptional regulator GlxA family with amidase domain